MRSSLLACSCSAARGACLTMIITTAALACGIQHTLLYDVSSLFPPATRAGNRRRHFLWWRSRSSPKRQQQPPPPPPPPRLDSRGRPRWAEAAPTPPPSQCQWRCLLYRPESELVSIDETRELGGLVSFALLCFCPAVRLCLLAPLRAQVARKTATQKTDFQSTAYGSSSSGNTATRKTVYLVKTNRN